MHLHGCSAREGRKKLTYANLSMVFHGAVLLALSTHVLVNSYANLHCFCFPENSIVLCEKSGCLLIILLWNIDVGKPKLIQRDVGTGVMLFP